MNINGIQKINKINRIGVQLYLNNRTLFIGITTIDAVTNTY